MKIHNYLLTAVLVALLVGLAWLALRPTARMPIRHRVPTAEWRIEAHYRCDGRGCRSWHPEYAFEYRWSPAK